MLPSVSDIPQEYLRNYEQETLMASSTTIPISNDDPNKIKSFSLVVPITDLGETGYDLKNEITFYVEWIDDGFIGHYYPLEIHSFGDTITEAIHELKADILDFHDYLLKKSQSELGENPKRWKAHLKQIIRKS